MQKLIIYLSVPILFLSHPSVSLLELQYIPSIILTIIPPHLWWIVRIPHAVLIGFSLFKISELYPSRRSLSILMLATMPWTIVISHEFNPFVSVLFVLLALYITTPARRRIILTAMAVLFSAMFILHSKTILEVLNSRLALLQKLFSLTTLFMQMEPSSSYLKIPRNGYFHPVYFIPLLVYIVRTIPFKISKLNKWIIPIIISLLFFFLFPTNHLILAGAGLLLLGSLILVQGAIWILKTIPWTKPLIYIVLIISTLVFFEMYIRQYPIMFAGERSEGKFNVIEFINNNAAKEYYLPDDHDLKYLGNLYLREFNNLTIQYVSQQSEWIDLYEVCKKTEVVCILDEGAIQDFPVEKTDSSISPIRLRNYLTIYYVL